jgi:DNA-binding NtrC family response regulator
VTREIPLRSLVLREGEVRPEDTLHETVPISRSSIDELRAAFVQRPMLVASHAAGAEWLPLEPGRSLVVGRAHPSDLVVKNPHLSRCHARFTLEGDELEVVDLDSHNGTIVRGVQVRRASLALGEVALLGRVRVSLQRIERGDDATLPGHETWFTWLEGEIRRAAFFRRPFAVLHVRGDDEAHLAEGWLPFVRNLLRPVDRVALYGPHAAWALLPESTRDEARRAARAIAEARHAHGPLFVGVSCFPEASSVESLTDDARSAARRATRARPVVDSSDATEPAPRSSPGAHGDVVAESAEMRAVLSTLERVAASDLPVLLLGETGSGKEVAARFLHGRSLRRDKPLVPVNCGALPAHLVESTLFGHEKGSFTGAVGLHKGVFEAASGGTVFLDEIGELPAPAQVALLRVLEAKRIARVGATQEIPVDVRIVAATHRDLEEMVREGRFRQDLLFRLETMTLRLPSLRDRKDDILPLARAMLLRAAGEGGTPKELSNEACAAVLAYAWPGNVRELKNAMDRASVVGFGESIALEDLPERLLRAHRAAASSAPPSTSIATADTGPAVDSRALLLDPPTFTDSATLDLRTRLARFEAAAILEALKASGGKQAAAAELLGLPLRTLKYKLAAIAKRRT